MSLLSCGRYQLPLSRPLVMGIVNLTTDSFSGDGLGADVHRTIAHARHQFEAGAQILDLGAESSRPGALPVSEQEELDRLLPVLEAVVPWGVPISVDTYKPAVMRAALQAGADMINDINALQAPGALEAVASHPNCGVCLMHMQGEPGTMQQAPAYADVLGEVSGFLEVRAAVCVAAGIAADRLALDPGFGFGKTLEHNRQLFVGLPQFLKQQLPVLVGVSRKSMLGAIIGKPTGQRMAASVVAAMLAAQKGAKILRVHDVAETCDALAVFEFMGQES